MKGQERLYKTWKTYGAIVWEGKLSYIRTDIPWLIFDHYDFGKAVAVARDDARAMRHEEGFDNTQILRQLLAGDDQWMANMDCVEFLETTLLQRQITMPCEVTLERLSIYLKLLQLSDTMRIPEYDESDGGVETIEFLFVFNGATPIVYAVDRLALVVRHCGRDFLGMCLSQEELQLRIQYEQNKLEGRVHFPVCQSNLSKTDWFTR